MAGKRGNHSQLRKWKLRPDVAKDTSGRNFRSVLAPIKRATFASCTSLYKFIRFIEATDTTALGDGFDCVGWKRQFRWLNEALEVAEWSTWCCWMKYLMLLNEALEWGNWCCWFFNYKLSIGYPLCRLRSQIVTSNIRRKKDLRHLWNLRDLISSGPSVRFRLTTERVMVVQLKGLWLYDYKGCSCTIKRCCL